MSRTFFSLRRRRGFDSRHPAPCHHGRRASEVVPLGLGLCCSSLAVPCSGRGRRRSVSKRNQAVRWYGVNHGSIGGSGPGAFSGYPRGHRDDTETGCHRHGFVYRRLAYSPSNPSVSRTDGPPPETITGEGRGASPETLKRLAILVVRRRSSLPSSQESA
jgi:hypothetical protein